MMEKNKVNCNKVENKIQCPETSLSDSIDNNKCNNMHTNTNVSDNCNAVQKKQSTGIDSFAPLKLLGKGSHGEVFLALHKSNYKPYAIKALSIEDIINRGQVEYVLTEIRVHKDLAKKKYPCPFITPMRWAFHNDTHIFLVFDFMEGGELYRHLCIRGSLPEKLAKFYAAEICIAIGYLHAIGVIYRDLKPENLCLDGRGHIYLIDLGLCKDGMILKNTRKKVSTNDSNKMGETSTINSQSEDSLKSENEKPINETCELNELCGTTEYLAPEILKFTGYGLNADWWSFGMVLYEMITGLPPWYSNDQSEMIEGILYRKVEFPNTISPEAKDIINKLLEKDPKKRLGGREGAKEIMCHPFFKDIDWVKIAKRGIDSPFLPPHCGSNMVNNFDEQFTKNKIASLLPSFVPVSLLNTDNYHVLVKASRFDFELNKDDD